MEISRAFSFSHIRLSDIDSLQRSQLCSKWQFALALHTAQVICLDPDLHASCGKSVHAETMINIL